MKDWIDFKELRARLDFEEVLRHYGVEVKRKGIQHLGYCPLPDHNGKKNSPSFSANLERGIFQCFGCKAKGNILEFAALMEKADLKDGAAVRKVAIALRDRFCGKGGEAVPKASPSERRKAKKDAAEVTANEPLKFLLKGLDPTHPYLASRGLTEETIAEFGFGYASRGMMKGRIAIPIHNERGLVAYAGRLVSEPTEDEERYRLPDGFRKSLEVYRLHKAIEEPEEYPLIIVEGFFSVARLWQYGIRKCVALMGSSLSVEQEKLIKESIQPRSRIILALDEDEAGRMARADIAARLSKHAFVHTLVFEEEGKQPDSLTLEEARALQLLPEEEL